jgi:hypothetical protein
MGSSGADLISPTVTAGGAAPARLLELGRAARIIAEFDRLIDRLRIHAWMGFIIQQQASKSSDWTSHDENH